MGGAIGSSSGVRGPGACHCGGGPGGGFGGPANPEDAEPDGASPPLHVELPGRGSPWIHDPFGMGGGGAFAGFFRAWLPFFVGSEAIGQALANNAKAMLDDRARAGGQRGAVEQEGCRLT